MKININKKRIIKIVSILMIIIQMIGLSLNLNVSNAEIKNGDVIMLKGDHECDSLVEFYLASTGRMSYKIVWYVYYEDGQKYPAFCVEPAKEGVGTGYSQYEGEILKEEDNCIWRILQKGYMGAKWTDWDLECDDDFYSATKIALHSYAEKIAPKDKYVLGTRSVDGNSVEEIQRRAGKTLDVAQALYEYGINGSEEYEEPQVSLKKQEGYTIEKIDNKEYYIYNYNVNSNKYLKSYDIEIEDFTSNTKILDSNNKEITNKKQINLKTFKIAIPIEEITDTIIGQINITNAEIKTNPVFYVKSSIPEAQSYVTYSTGYEKAQTSEKLIKEYIKKGSLKITKVDSLNKEIKLQGVEFELLTEKGKSLGKYITNENGEVQINDLECGKYIIKEVKTNQAYILDETEHIIQIQNNKEMIELEIANKAKPKLPRTGF